MKISLILCSLIIVCLAACAGKENKVNIPENIKTKFMTMYPHASNVKWEMEEGNYEAIYMLEKNETSVILTPEGTLVQTETEVDEKLLPDNIKNYVASQLGGKKITSATAIEKPAGGTSFEVEVDKVDYLFDATGQYIGKEEEEKDEDGEKD
ncbi:MAG: PepSY-like domain-containing protein [Saprospiraceae bacterium]